MHGMTPLEVKYHLKDIERRFVACQTLSEPAKGRPFTPFGWLRALVTRFTRPSTMVLKRPFKAAAAKSLL